MIELFVGDCREMLKLLPASSVHCCVTSPPYWQLRDYGIGGQLGLEPLHDCGGQDCGQCYVCTMVDVFRAVRRVLRADGTLWLNLGDTYSGGAGTEVPAKNLYGIPWRVALALQANGWLLRSCIIWHKPNCMPESAQDRPTNDFEFVFLLSKSARYYYDNNAIREPVAPVSIARMRRGNSRDHKNVDGVPGQTRHTMNQPRDNDPARAVQTTRNKRAVWTISTGGLPGAHFATFPPALVEPMIKAGTSERGCCKQCGTPWEREMESNGWRPTCACDVNNAVPCKVLDPFGGAGTVGLVADRLRRDAILIELNSEYVKMAERRIKADAPMFTTVSVVSGAVVSPDGTASADNKESLKGEGAWGCVTKQPGSRAEK